MLGEDESAAFRFKLDGTVTGGIAVLAGGVDAAGVEADGVDADAIDCCCWGGMALLILGVPSIVGGPFC
jgi:hypothetical protein